MKENGHTNGHKPDTREFRVIVPSVIPGRTEVFYVKPLGRVTREQALERIRSIFPRKDSPHPYPIGETVEVHEFEITKPEQKIIWKNGNKRPGRPPALKRSDFPSQEAYQAAYDSLHEERRLRNLQKVRENHKRKKQDQKGA